MLLKPVWRDEIYAVLNLKKQSKSKPQTKAFSLGQPDEAAGERRERIFKKYDTKSTNYIRKYW